MSSEDRCKLEEIKTKTKGTGAALLTHGNEAVHMEKSLELEMPFIRGLQAKPGLPQGSLATANTNASITMECSSLQEEPSAKVKILSGGTVSACATLMRHMKTVILLLVESTHTVLGDCLSGDLVCLFRMPGRGRAYTTLRFKLSKMASELSAHIHILQTCDSDCGARPA